MESGFPRGHAAAQTSMGPASLPSFATGRRLAFALLWLFVLTLPWENSVFVDAVGTVSRAAGMVALSTAALVALAAGRARRLHGAHLLALGFACWGMATFLWSEDAALTAERIRTAWQLLLMMWLIWEFAPEERQVAALMQAYVLGAYVSVASTGFDYLTRRGDAYARYMAAGFNPNGLGLLLAVGIPFSHYLALTAERPWQRWLCYAYAPAALAAILLTASRGAFLAALAALPIVPLTLWRGPRRRRWVSLLMAGMALVGALYFAPRTSWDRLSTIGYEVAAGSMNERRDIWQAGLLLAAEHPLLGLGAGAFRTSVVEVYGEEKAAHNTFLGVLVEQGAVGLVLFLSLLGLLLLATRTLPLLERQVWRVTFLTWAVGASVGEWEHRKLTWLLLALLVSHLAAAARNRRASPQVEGQPPAARGRRPAPVRWALAPPGGNPQ